MLILIVFLVINANAKKVPLIKLTVGEIVNITNLSYESTEILSDIFNGFDGNRFIETKNRESFYSFQRQKDVCINLESSMNYKSVPMLYVDDRKINLPIKMCNDSDMKHLYLSMDPRYINDNYLFSVVKECILKNEKSLKIRLFGEFDLTTTNYGVTPNTMYNKSGVLRFRKNSETSYVSSIFTGKCLYQVFMHTAELCNKYRLNNSLAAVDDSFFESYVYKSQIITDSGNDKLENEINNHFRLRSLTSDWPSSLKAKKDLFDNIDEETVVRIDLRSLPNLPEKPNEDEVSKRGSLRVFEPGDVINIDAENVHYVFNSGRMSREYRKPPSMSQEYTNCYQNESENLTLETSDSKEPNNPKHLYKFNVFHQMIKNYNYGVDKKYLNDNYKCFKLTVCSGLTGQKSGSPNLKIVNLDQFLSDDKYNIFENENITVIHGKNNTSYYVRSVESGNCLFQALMYPASATRYEVEYLHAFPVQRGTIISADRDYVLENRVKIFLASDKYNIYESLFTAKIDVLNVTLPIIRMLDSNKATISLYLNKID